MRLIRERYKKRIPIREKVFHVNQDPVCRCGFRFYSDFNKFERVHNHTFRCKRCNMYLSFSGI